MDTTTAAETFKRTGYIVLRNIIDVNEADRFYQYALQKIEQGNMDDGQVPGSPSFYQDKEMIKLQERLLPKIEAAIQLKLFITYCYHRIYRTGAVLRSHKDKSVCKVAATMNLGQKGEPWDIWLIDHDENPRQITLLPGDILIYRGNQLTHLRGRLKEADLVGQLLLFFVEQNDSNIFAVKIEQLKTWVKKKLKPFL